MLKGKGLLSDIQKDFLRLFAEVPDQDQFYLTGGTALAEFYLGHRLSYDLDLFTSEANLILPFSYRVEQAIQRAGMQVAIGRRFASFVEFQVNQGKDALKIDLALDSPFHLASLESTDAGVKVNDFQDIQADKTLAFYGRAEPRDAIDLFFLLQSSKLEDLTELARKKDTGFDPYWFAVALNRAAQFPDEIERWPVKMLVNCNPLVLKQTFQDLAMKIMASHVQ